MCTGLLRFALIFFSPIHTTANYLTCEFALILFVRAGVRRSNDSSSRAGRGQGGSASWLMKTRVYILSRRPAVQWTLSTWHLQPGKVAPTVTNAPGPASTVRTGQHMRLKLPSETTQIGPMLPTALREGDPARASASRKRYGQSIQIRTSL